MKPTLSIITICYNIKDEIERTCESIVEQTWQDFEWIVVDGGSTDGTLDILNKYKDRINILISEPDKGIYNAMNKGIKVAHGEWLNFMNGGDCFVDNTVLTKVFKNRQYESNILLGIEERYKQNNKLAYIQNPPKTINKFTFLECSLAHQSMFYRRALFEKYGAYDERFRYAADSELNLRFVAAGERVENLDVRVGKFMCTGVSHNRKAVRVAKEEHRIFNQCYFSKKELRNFNWMRSEKQLDITRIKLFNWIPLLYIERE